MTYRNASTILPQALPHDSYLPDALYRSPEPLGARWCLANHCLELITILLTLGFAASLVEELLYQRSHLDCLWPSAKDQHYCLSFHIFFSLIISFKLVGTDYKSPPSCPGCKEIFNHIASTEIGVNHYFIEIGLFICYRLKHSPKIR